MKLNCGPDKHEKRRIKSDKEQAKLKHDREWHKWFAWFPVRIRSRECRWLETLERRDTNQWKAYTYSDQWAYLNEKAPRWEYRTVNE